MRSGNLSSWLHQVHSLDVDCGHYWTSFTNISPGQVWAEQLQQTARLRASHFHPEVTCGGQGPRDLASLHTASPGYRREVRRSHGCCWSWSVKLWARSWPGSEQWNVEIIFLINIFTATWNRDLAIDKPLDIIIRPRGHNRLRKQWDGCATIL